MNHILEERKRIASQISKSYSSEELEKGGVGSGRKIGITKSGKDIFSHQDPSEYKDFTRQDHEDAAYIHSGARVTPGEFHHHGRMYASHIQQSELKKSQELDTLEKGGEGSRGGKVVAHTSSGKPIYESSWNKMKDLAKKAGKKEKRSTEYAADDQHTATREHNDRTYLAIKQELGKHHEGGINDVSDRYATEIYDEVRREQNENRED